MNAFDIVVPEKTVRIAVLLAVPVGTPVAVTPEVAFGFVPALLLVTPKITVQLVFARIVTLLKLNPVSPPANELGVVPVQVPVTLPATALILVSVSVNAASVKSNEFGFVSVSVTVEVPPEGIAAGPNAF